MHRSKYCFDRKPLDGLMGLFQHMTGKALRSPYRSTVPLLSLVEQNRHAWQSVLTAVGAPIAGTVHFEYSVPSPKAKGNPSQTDAMLISNATVWAIEAKWTEPRYETVEKRISKTEDDGADPRITVDGWLNYLRPFSSCTLSVDGFMGVVYQVLHRAASVCAVAAERKLAPHLVYLHFHPSPLQSSAKTAQYVSDLQDLYALIGNPSILKMTVVEMPLKPTAAFDAIKSLDKRAPESASLVKTALCKEPLFSFGSSRILTLGEHQT